jgi:hypothetical protein
MVMLSYQYRMPRFFISILDSLLQSDSYGVKLQLSSLMEGDTVKDVMAWEILPITYDILPDVIKNLEPDLC